MAHCCITLGHSAEDRTWIIIARLIGNSRSARRTEHRSSRKGHTGGVTILSGNQQSTLCLPAHVLATAAMHRGRHLKACRESLPALLMLFKFCSWNILISPCKRTEIQPACPLSLCACSAGSLLAQGPALRSLQEFWRRGTRELSSTNAPS